MTEIVGALTFANFTHGIFNELQSKIASVKSMLFNIETTQYTCSILSRTLCLVTANNLYGFW